MSSYCPTVTSRLKITNRSFFHYAPVLWNNLPVEMRQTSSSTHSNTMPTSVLPCLALSSPQFHSRLKTYLFHHSYPPIVCCTCRTDSGFRLGSHSHSLNHSHSFSFTPPFLFTAELIQCLRVSHLVWNDFYRHFKSPYSLCGDFPGVGEPRVE